MKDMQEAMTQDPSLIPDKKSMKSYLPHNRHLVIDYPGVANVRVGNVSIPGNRALVFTDGGLEGAHPDDFDELVDQAGGGMLGHSAADLFNLYFLHRGNLIITDWKLDGTSIAVMITTQLDKEQLDDMGVVQEVVNTEMAKRRQAREDEKAQAEEKQAELEHETRRKLLLAEKAEKQGWENRIKELEETNAKLSKDIKALKKASK
jgi:hypothetical protein